MPNSLHTNKIKDEKDAFVNELFDMIPKREELISGEASAIATQIHKLYLTIYIMNYFKSQKLIDMGFSVLAIGERMGHEAEKITYRYAYLFPTVQTEMAEKLEMERMTKEDANGKNT